MRGGGGRTIPVRASLTHELPVTRPFVAIAARGPVDPLVRPGVKADTESMEARRKIVSVDDRGRAYLSKLGFERGATVVADPVEGEELAWILRPGRVVTDTEFQILADAANVESLVRAAQESARGDDTLEVT